MEWSIVAHFQSGDEIESVEERLLLAGQISAAIRTKSAHSGQKGSVGPIQPSVSWPTAILPATLVPCNTAVAIFYVVVYVVVYVAVYVVVVVVVVNVRNVRHSISQVKSHLTAVAYGCSSSYS